MSLDTAEVQKLLNDFELESKALKQMIIKLCWYMRGGLSIEEGWVISPEDREIISTLIQENLETTKESGLPFF